MVCENGNLLSSILGGCTVVMSLNCGEIDESREILPPVLVIDRIAVETDRVGAEGEGGHPQRPELQREHVLDGHLHAVLGRQPTDDALEAARVADLPQEGRVHDHRRRTHGARELGRADELVRRVEAPHELREQEHGCVHREDRSSL